MNFLQAKFMALLIAIPLGKLEAEGGLEQEQKEVITADALEKMKGIPADFKRRIQEERYIVSFSNSLN